MGSIKRREMYKGRLSGGRLKEQILKKSQREAKPLLYNKSPFLSHKASCLRRLDKGKGIKGIE